MARGKHKTVPRELKQNVAWIESQGAKVILGMSDCARHKFAPGHIKIQGETEAGLRANGYSGNGVIRFFIRCKDDETLEKIKARFA